MSELDIVIPVYNEGKSIIDVLEQLKKAVKTPFRILICYDDERDNTLAALEGYDSSPVEIRLVKNRGRGAHGAILSGFRDSTASAVIMMPADDTYNAGIIDAMYQKFQQGCEIVVASRFVPGGRMEGCPWLKAALVRCAAFTLYYCARLPTRDASNGFRLFSRKVIDRIDVESTQGFAYSLELLVKCHRLGWPVAEVAALWIERTQGESRFKVLRWLPAYLRWYFYGFATTFLRRGADTVFLKEADSRPESSSIGCAHE